MYYVYVLRSQKDHKLYIGFTADLKRRFEEHNGGVSPSTKGRRPFDLIYYEACRSRADAMHREKYLKTTYGHRYLKSRLKRDSDEG